MKQRLQKILSQAGLASRRAAEQLIVEGRVQVNAKKVDSLGSQADPMEDRITVDGKSIKREKPAYLMMNKPKGYICSMKDPIGRRTVKSLLKNVRERVYPVGRLDYNSEGLLLFTNDGEVAHSLMHPSGKVKKQYLAKIKGKLSEDDIARIRNGIYLSDGRTQPAEIKVIKRNGNSWVLMTISEGKKHQIRRMLEQLGHPVLKLKRTAYGFLTLGRLPIGKCRFLSVDEISRLKRLTKRTK